MRSALLSIHIGFAEKKMIIVTVSAALLLIISFLIYVDFIRPRFDQLLASLDNLHTHRRILSIKEKNLDEQQENMIRLSAMDSDKPAGHIPTETETPGALLLLSRKMTEKAITETGFYIEPSENYNMNGLPENESVVVQLVTITGAGAYADVLEYFESLNNAEYFYQPVSYTITSRDMLKQDSVRFTLKLKLFILKGAADQGKPRERSVAAEVDENIKNPFFYTE